MPTPLVSRIGALCAALATLLLALPASAEAPAAASVAGVLSSVGGAPVSDGKYTFTFSIYNTQTGGIALWTEVIPSVTVTGGRFDAALGLADPAKPFPAQKLATEAEIWLAMRVYDDPDLPRVRLLSTPFSVEALHAKSAQTADTAKSADSAKTADKAADVQCTACVSVAELVFDGPVDLKGNALASGAITSSSSVKAVSFEGDGSKLTGIKIPQGTCGDGKFATGIDTDGNLVCSTIPTAADVSCTGCITPEKVAFQYAGSDAKGGPALTSYDVTCTGCVTVAEMKFDKDVDLGAKALTTTGTVTAASFLGDGSKLSGIKIPAGKCDAGKVLTGLNADGSLVCATFTISPAGLPNDGLNEISNNLLSNQFTFVNAGKPNLPIPDYNLSGVIDTLTVPANLGLAQKLTVTVNIAKAKSGIEKEFTLKLTDPNNAVYILHDKTSTLSGMNLATTYPEPTKTISGDLTSWIGQNPGGGTNGGKWTLTAIDNNFDGGGSTTDGQVTSWSINVQVVSNSQVQMNGDFMITGKLIGSGGINITGDTLIDGTLTVNKATTLKDTLSVTGATTIGGTAGVSGVATFADAIIGKKGATLSNGISLGNDSASCDSSKTGTVRHANGKTDVCNGTAWAALSWPNPFPNSTIINADQAVTVNHWVGMPERTWKVCYRKTVNGGNSSTFHSLCDQKGDTVTFAKLTTGKVIGGYTSCEWNGNNYNGYKNCGGFLFSITNMHKMMANGNNSSNGIYDHISYGPTFGCNHDWYVDSSMNAGYCNPGCSYSCRKFWSGRSECQSDFCGGYNNWNINDLEVWYYQG